jgi:hypothetical protein
MVKPLVKPEIEAPAEMGELSNNQSLIFVGHQDSEDTESSEMLLLYTYIS